MKYNPLIKEIEAIRAKIANDISKMHACSDLFIWAKKFNLEEAHASHEATKRKNSGLCRQLEVVKQRLSTQLKKTNEFEMQASLGFDPLYWFSTARAVAKRQLEAARQNSAILEREYSQLKTFINNNEDHLKQVQNDIARFRSFDELLVVATQRGLQVKISALESQLFSLHQRKNDLDAKLGETPLILTKRETELEELRNKLSCAEQYDHNLSNAQTSRERAVIHAECEKEFGKGKPREVMRELRSKIKTVENGIVKLTQRIDHIIECAMRDVDTLVIDGNNMCYQQSDFIGLDALKALIPQLALKYKIQLIFDSNIRGLVRMNDNQLRECFPGVLVHVVASKIKADETILDVAEGNEHFFVVSNDRFADFPEKNVVRQARLIRHEIVNGKAYIHDLSIEAQFLI